MPPPDHRSVRPRLAPILGGWPLLLLAFGILVALELVSGFATLREAGQLYSSLSELSRNYRRVWSSLEEIRSGIQVSSLLVRDYLLDSSQVHAGQIRAELLALRRQTETHLANLESASASSDLARLRSEIHAYWDSLHPVLDLTPRQKQATGFPFLRDSIMPRRDAVLALAQEVQSFTEAAFEQQNEATIRREEEFRRFLRVTIGATAALGVVIAFFSIFRVLRLQRRWERERLRATQAEDQLRRLSHQLVQAQEEERRAISRELHDEVGQMLTGLRMDLRSLKRVSPAALDQRIDQTCTLLEQTLHSVRDIAMGLRPSMLDDLGLEAALRWQAREFERRHDIRVTLQISGSFAHLPDSHRTTLYRIVQEGLTNCARHAKPTAVTIELSSNPDALRLRLADDGLGFRAGAAAGLGLLGIEERVRELDGAFRVESQPGHGARLVVELPQHQTVPHA